MKNMLIAQSGGPTAAINASLAGALKQAMESSEIDIIFGARNGIEGLLREDIVEMRPLFRSEADFALLRKTPAMALGSCRLRLADEPDVLYEKLAEILRKYEIKYFLYTGGNDSMDTVKKLSDYFRERNEDIRVVGIPKTIDNDLACTDHTPGFGSAAKFVATSVAEIACDSDIYSPESITVVEIMGRNAGWLTSASVLARRPGCTAPHMICLPEIPFDKDLFLNRVRSLRQREKHLILAVSEGLQTADGVLLSSKDNITDPFGHSILSGAGQKLGAMVKQEFHCKVRVVELNVLQRAAAHLQSEVDIREAGRLGAEAVSLAVEGKTGVMPALVRVSNHPYIARCECVDVNKVANIERLVPLEWIDAENMDVRKDMVDYLTPLIQNPSQKEFGIPLYFRI